MDRTKLSETARQDAEALTCAGSVRAQALCRRGAHALTALRHRRERLAADADSASQWLLDNWYLAEREARDALQTLRHAHALRAAGASEVACQDFRKRLRCAAGSLPR